MNFIGTQNWNEEIQRALKLIPKSFHKYLQCDLMLGADPNSKGLHDYKSAFNGKYLYKDLAHVAYAHNQLDIPRSYRITTVVLPQTTELYTPIAVETVIHEFGHVLHEKLGWPEGFYPVTAYAESNVWECFAEAFTEFCSPGYHKKKGKRGGKPLHPDDYLWFSSLLKISS